MLITVDMCLYLKVTLSTVNSRPSISRAPANSSPSASSNTPLNKATADSPRDTVRMTHATCHMHSCTNTRKMNEQMY